MESKHTAQRGDSVKLIVKDKTSFSFRCGMAGWTPTPGEGMRYCRQFESHLDYQQEHRDVDCPFAHNITKRRQLVFLEMERGLIREGLR